MVLDYRNLLGDQPWNVAQILPFALITKRYRRPSQACPASTAYPMDISFRLIGDVKAVAERNFRFFDAPVVVYVCMDRSLSPYSMLDLGAVSQSIMLAAQEYGLAFAPAVMLAAYPELIHKALGIPDDKAIVLGIALGYAETGSIHNQYRSGRRPVEEMAELFGF